MVQKNVNMPFHEKNMRISIEAAQNTSKTTSCPTERKLLMEGGAELWRCHVSRKLSGDEVTGQSLSPSKNSHRK